MTSSFALTIDPKQLETLPLEAFKGKIEVIDHKGLGYARAIAYLNSQKILGFDTETRPSFEVHHLHHDVALLQLSGPDKAYLFRLNKLGFPKTLRGILANPNIIKVGAACKDDARGLQRLAPFEPHGFLDLQSMVWEWGIKDKSVKKMAAIILGIRISKSQQLSNWEADCLTPAQQLYAATDAWVCREMYLELMDSPKHPIEYDEQGNIKER